MKTLLHLHRHLGPWAISFPNSKRAMKLLIHHWQASHFLRRPSSVRSAMHSKAMKPQFHIMSDMNIERSNYSRASIARLVYASRLYLSRSCIGTKEYVCIAISELFPLSAPNLADFFLSLSLRAGWCRALHHFAIFLGSSSASSRLRFCLSCLRLAFAAFSSSRPWSCHSASASSAKLYP